MAYTNYVSQYDLLAQKSLAKDQFVSIDLGKPATFCYIL